MTYDSFGASASVRLPVFPFLSMAVLEVGRADTPDTNAFSHTSLRQKFFAF